MRGGQVISVTTIGFPAVIFESRLGVIALADLLHFHVDEEVFATALTLLCQGFDAFGLRSANMNGYNSLMRYRFRHRWISLFDMPSAERRWT